MAGIEAVGFILGVLPLIISAAEHYEDIFRPFKRFQKFVPELELYQQQLRTQKTIFRNECFWLLATLTGRHLAKEMLKASSHMSWSSPDLDKKLAEQLGESGLACKDIIQLIQAKLKVIEEETEKFGLVIQQSCPIGSIGDKAWRSRIGKKLKFGFSEPRLEKCLEDLRKLNQDFRVLGRQTSGLDVSNRSSPTPGLIPLCNDRKIQECKLVQRASAKLYQALQTACQLHEEHSAHIRLEPQNASVEVTGLPQVRFNMAFSHCVGSAINGLEPIWIAIDSTFHKIDSQSLNMKGKNSKQLQGPLQDLSTSLKHKILGDVCPVAKRTKTKSVRFVTLASASSNIIHIPIPPKTLPTGLPDFCINRDFCKQLQNCEKKSSQNKHIGYFEKAGACEHLVYFAPPITTCSITQTISLAQMISSISHKAQSHQFLEYERLRLARQLASAVLQFHTTPLLLSSWRSQDVIFFGASMSSPVLVSPHLNVQVRKTHRAVANQVECASKETQAIIRNPYFFSLGVVLIELAYQVPLRELREDQDLVDGLECNLTEFFVAKRLSESIGSRLGLTYSRIVKKCLSCDFGEGTTDLNDSGLQRAFYKDVVCELERLERAFAMLQLAA